MAEWQWMKMSWATNHIQKLLNKEVVKFRPHGNSMLPKIKSGQLCTLEPIVDFENLNSGDVVLCKVKGRHFLHLISAIKENQYQISNNQGFINGWINKDNIFGILTKVEK